MTAEFGTALLGPASLPLSTLPPLDPSPLLSFPSEVFRFRGVGDANVLPAEPNIRVLSDLVGDIFARVSASGTTGAYLTGADIDKDMLDQKYDRPELKEEHRRV
jgi:hypothetical protein